MKTGNASQGPKRPSKEELALLLRDAVRHSVAVEREALLASLPKPPSRARPIAIGIFCAALLAFSVWSVLARPEFIWGPQSGTIAPERAEASTRMAMYLMARRLDLHREREGDYPERLTDVGGDVTLGYRRLESGGFELVSDVNGRQLKLASSDDRTAFLGNSRDLVQQPVRR